MTEKNLYFTEFSTKIHCNTRLAASDAFHVFTQSIKGTFNADLKISLYVRVHIRIIPWKFCILNLKNCGVIYP